MTAVLVDTSVWVDHFRVGNTNLIDLLQSDAVLMHPLVLGELACGTPPKREQTLADLGSLQAVRQATMDEALMFIERNRLYGQGLGLVDVLLLASVLITPGTLLWTLDKRLTAQAKRLGVAHQPKLH